MNAILNASTYEPLVKFWVKADQPSGQSIFSFSEYLAALALLLVVIAISDFRYRLRLTLAGPHIRYGAFIASAVVGLAILGTDFWFHNRLPVPFFLNSATNVKAIIGLIFLILVLSLHYLVFLSPPKYKRGSALRFAQTAYSIVGEGDPIRIQSLLRELGPNLSAIFKMAALPIRKQEANPETEPPEHVVVSNDLLYLFADPRLCAAVAQSSPWFALEAIKAYQSMERVEVPFSGFLMNASRAFLRNKSSMIYLEGSGYETGYVGFVRQVSNGMYGDFNTVENCARDGQSPFDIDFKEQRTFDGLNVKVYCRCALIFFRSYLVKTEGRTHSYAFARLMNDLDAFVHGLERLNDPSANEWPNPEHERLDAVVDFVGQAIEILDELNISQRNEPGNDRSNDPYQYLAELIAKLVLAATSVDTKDFITWRIQHNSVWAPLMRGGNSRAQAIIRKRVFRLMYADIKEMGEFPNFKGARILAFCLNVLGLSPGDRHKTYGREDYPLRKLASDWTKANYRNLLQNHPKVAQACLTYRVEYDAEKHRLVKTFPDLTSKEPRRSFLELD